MMVVHKGIVNKSIIYCYYLLVNEENGGLRAPTNLGETA